MKYKDGYYWIKDCYGDWLIGEIEYGSDEYFRIYICGNEMYYEKDDFEIGDYIEVPDKYKLAQ